MAHSASENLLGWSFIHNGDWDKIYAEINTKKPFDFTTTPLATIKSKIYGNYVTLLDSDYPEYFRSRVAKAPFCIFYKGDINILNENNAVGIIAYKISISQAINKYSQYALIQAIKQYAPNNHIYLQVSEEYRELAIKTFRKYAGIDKHLIEFTNKSLQDYDASIPTSNHSDLVITTRWNSDNTPVVAMLQSFSKTCKKIVVTECPPARSSVADMFINMAISDNKDLEVVPYPFFDKYHANNDLIADGALMFKQTEEDK